MNAPPPTFRPDGHPNWMDRLSPRTRDLGGAVLIVVFLFGWATLFRFALPNEPWQDIYAMPVFMTVAVLGFRWAPEPGTPPAQTLRARRARAWVSAVGLLALFPFLVWANDVFDGFVIGVFMLMVGVLVERWRLGDFKWRNLFGDSQRVAPSERKHRPLPRDVDRY